MCLCSYIIQLFKAREIILLIISHVIKCPLPYLSPPCILLRNRNTCSGSNMFWDAFSVKSSFFPLAYIKCRLNDCRNMLGYFLLSRKQRGNDHVVRRCCVVAAFDPIKQDFRSSHEIIGAEAVACLATSSCNSNFLLPTCIYQISQSVSIFGLIQR